MDQDFTVSKDFAEKGPYWFYYHVLKDQTQPLLLSWCHIPGSYNTISFSQLRLNKLTQSFCFIFKLRKNAYVLIRTCFQNVVVTRIEILLQYFGLTYLISLDALQKSKDSINKLYG